MKNDTIVRLAAANPVPREAPLHVPAPRRTRRPALALALAAAVAVPAVAFAGQLGTLLGISNDGTAVPTGSILRGDSRLDDALQSMSVGPTMQSLGELNGIVFYATRNAAGNFCLAFDHVSATVGKGVLCDLNEDNFPSADVKAISFPQTLLGVAADGVAKVALVDADGNVIDSTPVVDNLFASDEGQMLRAEDAAYLETLDANGNVLTRQKRPN
jgi:hypothetical protein